MGRMVCVLRVCRVYVCMCCTVASPQRNSCWKLVECFGACVCVHTAFQLLHVFLWCCFTRSLAHSFRQCCCHSGFVWIDFCCCSNCSMLPVFIRVCVCTYGCFCKSIVLLFMLLFSCFLFLTAVSVSSPLVVFFWLLAVANSLCFFLLFFFYSHGIVNCSMFIHINSTNQSWLHISSLFHLIFIISLSFALLFHSLWQQQRMVVMMMNRMNVQWQNDVDEGNIETRNHLTNGTNAFTTDNAFAKEPSKK